MGIQRIFARSSFELRQWLVLTTLIFAGLILMPFGALAGQIISPYDIRSSGNSIADEADRSPSQSPETERTATAVQESGQAGHEADEVYVHRDNQSTGSLIQVDNVNKLDDQIVAGINTTSSDLKTLLVPGTIVHFWASWCRPCEEEIPQLDRFYRNHISNGIKANGVQLITISNDRTVAPAARFIEKHGTTFPVYLDTEQASNLAVVGQRVLPSTVMVGADGRFHRLALGKLDWDFAGLPEILAATAAPKPETGRNTEKTDLNDVQE